ncbi:pyridoxal-phosphate dependent enzyme [Bermanella marisrubri]|uniref:Putative D-cysteine desulfhydrase, PLP-dependent enzyme n=1 Tax=Bermanella marisrubri TaxID=207949 RepID=Q1N624_9GAMM|nr:pyridoxal-phosphate dependent enzyme [Bermanella marisrubri]EAT13768.1 putative D-cysteine desulfhydrase, PLP-dependent enzyme [Oceanobacter sp. RED65] [Bermanella marisrubri]QIZ84539.1 pyridoxal-phosphate dependent enzyme [Bermanella marisrubri]
MSSIQLIEHPLFKQQKVTVCVKRDDQVHPIISGNKWYKLKYHFQAFFGGQYDCLASFGGPYSNHLHALAYAGKEKGVRTIGFIRGEQILPLNPTLRDCVDWGMTLIPISRQQYKLKHDLRTLKAYQAFYPNMYIIPEGGSGILGVKGSMGMVSVEQAKSFDHIVVAAGTGTTAAGIIANVSSATKVHVIAALKAKQWLENEISHYLDELCISGKQWSVFEDYTFGGYAKRPRELLDFIERENKFLPLEPIYTAKAWFALHEMIHEQIIPSNERVLFIHTGGLQGWR